MPLIPASEIPSAAARKGAASLTGRDIVKSFPTATGMFKAVDGVSLTIKSGEFVSLIGPSGCGKSTFMLMAAGLQPLTKGELLIDGRKLDKPLTDVGIVFQDHLLLEFRTALENVMLQAQIRKMPLAPARARAMELFEKLGIAHAADRYPQQLSGGMRQRVAIARALIHEPSVLMMDEPFGALDAITRTQIRHDLEVLWMETGKTVLFITHSLEEAIGLSDRVLVMSPTPGRIVEEIAIELPRPRPAHLGEYPAFNKYADRIHESFRRYGIIKY
jgi:NitT/TauT family transport system ATP-binding protein